MPVDLTTLQPPAKPDDKYVWGWDPDAGEWVPVDRSMSEGSTLGNLGRAAGRGFENVWSGLREASTGETDPNLAARSQAASAGAPVAEAIGGFAPEAAAGALAAAGTGGLGLVPALALEGAAAGGVSALRPGTFEERMLNAALSASGQALGGAAARGIASALRIGRGVLSGTSRRVADGIEAGAERVRASELERAAVEAEAQQAGAGGAQSAGAAATPEGELGQQYGEMGRALQQTEAAGADLSEDVTLQRMRERANELGIRQTPGFGSRGLSPARLAQSAHEMNPFGDVIEQQIKSGNQARVAELLHTALGSDNPKGSMLFDDLAQAEQRVGQRFDYIEERMPMMPQKELGTALGDVQQVRGVAGRSKGQKFVDDAIEEIGKREGEFMTPAEWMDTRRTFQGEMARLYAQGDVTSGDTIMKAVEKMDRLAERRFRRAGRDRLLQYWERSRRQYQVLMAAKRGSAVSPSGEVNVKSLLNGLKRDRSSGGFGLGGPARGTPERDLFDALQIVAHGESGVPMTGARLLIQQGMRSTAGKLGAAGAAGLLGQRLFD